MKKLLFALIALTWLNTNSTYAQNKVPMAVFAEVGGPGLASINFDTRFAKKATGLGGRIGVGGFSVDGTGVTFIPVGVNYLLGKDNKNFFEIGGGVTYANVSDRSFSDGSIFEGSFGHLNFGYRLQPANGGFFFRAAINPIFGRGYFMPYYAGLAFGYSF
ncbi:MAG: hypothetical protein MUF12_03280 [Sediminibacterium sp.]|jgi:hypothetical protein|nr:hypothetical protein [Sediminibacterium sp.]